MTKWALVGVVLAHGAMSQPAAAQEWEQPSRRVEPGVAASPESPGAPGPSVPMAPQQREGPPPPANDSELGLTWGDRQPTDHAGYRPLPREPLAMGTGWPSTRPWYGWQLLTSDAISLSLAGLGVALDSQAQPTRGDTVLELGLIGYAFVPPVIHLAHARFGMVPASLALRVLTPGTGFLLGMAAQNCNGSTASEEGICVGTGSTVGFLLGIALASAIDASLFARDNPRPAALFDARSLGVTPVLSADGKRAELRAFGRF